MSSNSENNQSGQISKGIDIGRYHIIEKLGAGGMGEVWLANDPDLDRKVALKFLPPELCGDEDCRARFKREAQAIAKLEHPNIITIHEVSEFSGRPYFAMQYIEGKTLHNIIKNDKLCVNRILDIVYRICEGLLHAHNTGIFHRDVKPANIIIDDKNRPSLLDFGLASIKGKEKLTKTGSTVGTTGYMSPEQIKGEKLDHRSDLFSLGVVFYEMIAGKHPFTADHEAAIHYNIVNENSPVLPSNIKNLTNGVLRIIDKLLEKDPKLRYQSAEDLLIDLKREQISQSDPSRSSGVFGADRSKNSRIFMMIAALIMAIIVVGSGVIYFSRQSQPAIKVQRKQVTFWGDIKTFDISPDGTQLIYSRKDDSQYGLFLQDLDGSEPLKLLSIEEIFRLRFSPDGTKIAFAGIMDSLRTEAGLYVTSRLGGEPRQLDKGICSDYSLTWSYDSKRIAIQESCSRTKDSIIIIDVNSGEKKYISIDIIIDQSYNLDWSPDGNKFIITAVSNNESGTWIIDTNGTILRKISDLELNRTTWSGKSDHLYYMAYQGGTGNLIKDKISQISTDAENPKSILYFSLDASDFSISNDYKRLLYLKYNSWSNIWLTDLDSTENESIIFTEQLTTGTYSVGNPAYSPDGKYIAFSKSAYGKRHIWIMPSSGGKAKQVSYSGERNYYPAWSPDNNHIAFLHHDSSSNKTIKINDLDGNAIKNLKNIETSGSYLIWPRDTIMLIPLTDNRNIRIYNPDTEESRLLFENAQNAWMFYPVLSPESEWLVLLWNFGQETGLWMFSMVDTTKNLILKGWTQPLGWSEKGDSIYYAINQNWDSGKYKFICRINIHDKSIDTLFTIPFDNITMGTAAIAPNRRQFVFDVNVVQKDLWLLENFDPDVK